MRLERQAQRSMELATDALHEEVRAANADVEAALRRDKELQNQRDMAGVANVARVRCCCPLAEQSLSRLPERCVPRRRLQPCQALRPRRRARRRVLRTPQFLHALTGSAGSASLVVWLSGRMTLAQALGVTCAVDVGATLLIAAYIASGNVGQAASGAGEHLFQRASHAARGGGAGVLVGGGAGAGGDGEGRDGPQLPGSLAALLETALQRVLRLQPAAEGAVRADGLP